MLLLESYSGAATPTAATDYPLPEFTHQHTAKAKVVDQEIERLLVEHTPGS